MLDVLTIYLGHVSLTSVYSEEQLRVFKESKCPRCGETIKTGQLTYIDVKGESRTFRSFFRWKSYVPYYNVYHHLSGGFRAEFLKTNGGTKVECYRCRGRWPLIKDSSQLTPPADVVAPASNDQIVSRVNELDLEEEQQGTEHRLIDNSRSPVSVTRQVLVKHEWSRRYDIGFENTLTVGGEGSVGTELLAKCKVKVEDEIKLRYSIVNDQKETFQEEITVEVPPRTKIRLIIRWKQMWQTGEVRIQLLHGHFLRVPYRVAKNVTFDQSIIEEV